MGNLTTLRSSFWLVVSRNVCLIRNRHCTCRESFDVTAHNRSRVCEEKQYLLCLRRHIVIQTDKLVWFMKWDLQVWLCTALIQMTFKDLNGLLIKAFFALSKLSVILIKFKLKIANTYTANLLCECSLRNTVQVWFDQIWLRFGSKLEIGVWKDMTSQFYIWAPPTSNQKSLKCMNINCCDFNGNVLTWYQHYNIITRELSSYMLVILWRETFHVVMG